MTVVGVSKARSPPHGTVAAQYDMQCVRLFIYEFTLSARVVVVYVEIVPCYCKCGLVAPLLLLVLLPLVAALFFDSFRFHYIFIDVFSIRSPFAHCSRRGALLKFETLIWYGKHVVRAYVYLAVCLTCLAFSPYYATAFAFTDSVSVSV